MYHLVLTHSILRWVVLLGLLWAIFRAWKGLRSAAPFRPIDRIAVSAGSISSHIQLLVGFALYFWSPTAQAYWAQKPSGWNDSLFFAIVHFGLMTVAIILITIGSALAKRPDSSDAQKFKSVLLYYLIALIIILVAIPWPFSPLAERPYFRPF